MWKKLLRLEYLAVLALLVAGIYLRSYRLDFPLADWHSWRQADTASVARNFARDGINFLYPQSDNLQPMNEYGLDNPNRYFINEFPLYNAMVALFYQQYGVNPAYGRMVSIFFAALGSFFLYLLVRRTTSTTLALITLFFYTFNPFNIFYGRVFMPDPAYVAMSIVAVYWCVRWVDSKNFWHGLLMGLSFAIATLFKPYALFIALPMFYWVLVNWKFKLFTSYQPYLLAVLALLPLYLWRRHVDANPEGTFSSTWLYNGGDIRWTGAFFRWLIFDRFNRLIFATGGFVLFVVGIFKSYTLKSYSLYFVWLLALMAFFTIFAKGNVTHDYYQMPLLPVGSFLVALGAKSLIGLGNNFMHKFVNCCLVGILLLLSFAFGWYEVRGYFNINNMAIVEAGRRVDEITPPDALVIAPYMSDPAFLYQTNRHGWPLGGEIEDKIKKGAGYYVTTSKNEEYNELKAKYTLIEENDSFAIIKLEEKGK